MRYGVQINTLHLGAVQLTVRLQLEKTRMSGRHHMRIDVCMSARHFGGDWRMELKEEPTMRPCGKGKEGDAK